MDGLTLLRRARDAGLAVVTEGEKLVIRGPRRAEAIARLLIEHKPEVMAALVAKPVPDAQLDPAPAWWRRQYLVRTINWKLCGTRSESQARCIAWGELQDLWQRLRGCRTPLWQCAGCREAIGSLPAVDLADGNRAHLNGAHGLACLLLFGERWRGEATAGLQALGLDPPPNLKLP
jgi:hypothetical protein